MIIKSGIHEHLVKVKKLSKIAILKLLKKYGNNKYYIINF